MRVQKIKALLDQHKAKHIVLLCHHNADPDATYAAFAFSRLLKRLNPSLEVKIAAAQGPSKLTKSIMQSLPVELTAEPRLDEADVIILLDTNTIQQLGAWGECIEAAGAPLVVVDHHARHPETERLATIYVGDDTASSTCEIVYDLFKEASIEIGQSEATALFIGIAFDTRHFILATSATLKAVADLVDSDVNAQEVLPLISLVMDESERVARLKASQRAKLLNLGKWLVLLSHVNAYQASAARALIRTGADVAIVAGRKGGEIQTSLRSSRDFYEKTGVHLGRDIAKPLGEFLHGMGGGHAVSAGANGKGSLEAVLNRCARLLKKRLD